MPHLMSEAPIPGALQSPYRLAPLIVLGLWAIACTGSPNGGAMDGELVAGADMPLGPLPEAGGFLSDGQFRFAVDLHQELVRQSPEQNVVFSPWGAWKSLAVLRAMGTEASGDGAAASRELKEASLSRWPYLNGDGAGGASSAPLDPEVFEGAYTELQRRVAHSGKHHGQLLDTARLFVDSWERVHADAADALLAIFGVESVSVDFESDPDGAAAQVAAWTGEAPGAARASSSETVMLLASKLEFDAAWAVRFDESLTRDRPFVRLDGSEVSVPMMAFRETPKTRIARIGEPGQANEANLLRLPYEGAAFEMVVIVPVQVNGLPAVEAWLTPERLTDGILAAAPRKVPIGLPRLELEALQELRPALEGLGLTRPFEPDGLDASRLVAGHEGKRQLTSVLQSVRVRVDEAGTKASVITKSNMILASIEMPIVADRPFLFLIREGTSGAALLMGRIIDPSQGGD